MVPSCIRFIYWSAPLFSHARKSGFSRVDAYYLKKILNRTDVLQNFVQNCKGILV